MCLLKLWFFHEPLITETHNKCHWIWYASNPKYTPLSNFNVFFPVKINKLWNFCLKLWFFRNHLLQRLKTCGIGFGMPQTLNMALKPFQCIFPSPNQQNVKCWLFPYLPQTKKLKKCQFAQGKSVCKDLQICTCRVLCMQITMHYVRTLCDKYILSYYGFSAFCMGRSRYRVLKHGVGVKWDPRRTAAYVPSHVHGFEPYFLCVS